MASQYDYQKPSTLATRTLISDTKPSALPSSSSSQDSSDPHKPTLQRKPTNNYENAVAEAGKVTTPISHVQSKPETDKPGLNRQQSWKMSDFKRERHGQMLAGAPVSEQGYTSTGGQ